MEEKYYKNWHLAKEPIELRQTELEFALIRCQEAFNRWVQAADEMAGTADLKPAEHIMLHVIRMQNRAKTGPTIARLLNRDDLPNVQYSLRKLEKAGLIEKGSDGSSKAATYSIAKEGIRITDEYSRLRREILISNLKALAEFESRAEDATRLLSILTGFYEEAARTSASYNRAS